MTLKENVLKDECGTPAVPVMPRKRKVFAARDFPVNCGPSFLALDKNSKMQGPTAILKSSNVKEENEPKPKTNVQVSVCDSIKLLNEGQRIETKVPPPWRRISANRTFPLGCGRKTLPADDKVTPNFAALETSGLHENTLEGEKTKETELQKTTSLGMKGKMQQNDGQLSQNISKNSLQKMISGTSEL